MSDFNRSAPVEWGLRAYLLLTFAFVFAPIAASFVFSFNVDRFPSLPLGGFSLTWYQQVAADPLVWEGLRNSVIVGVTVSILATALGFGAAYTDFRYRFFGKSLYLALALLPPTIPVVILGLAMLAFLANIGLSGAIHSVIIAHVVMCAPFAMAIIRLRLSQMDPSLAAGDLRGALHHHGGLLRRVRGVLVRLGPQRDAAGQGSRLPAGPGQPEDQRDRHLRLPDHDDPRRPRPDPPDETQHRRESRSVKGTPS